MKKPTKKLPKPRGPRIVVECDEAEAEAFRERARHTGLSLSGWARQLMRRGAGMPTCILALVLCSGTALADDCPSPRPGKFLRIKPGTDTGAVTLVGDSGTLVFVDGLEVRVPAFKARPKLAYGLRASISLPLGSHCVAVWPMGDDEPDSHAESDVLVIGTDPPVVDGSRTALGLPDGSPPIQRVNIDIERRNRANALLNTLAGARLTGKITFRR